jgi:hypothetical protein
MNISLLIIEKRLQILENILIESEEDGNVLSSSIRDSIDSDARTKLANIIKAMRNEIALLRGGFHVPVEDEPVSARRQMLSALTEILNILDELRPSAFESYGRIDQEDRKELELHISKLRSMADEFYSAMNKKGEHRV